jgi:hypothetical protein
MKSKYRLTIIFKGVSGVKKVVSMSVIHRKILLLVYDRAAIIGSKCNGLARLR